MSKTETSLALRRCAHCDEPLTGKRPQARYCGELCRDRARRQRDREAGRYSYVPKGYPKTRPSRQRYKPGHRFIELVLVERLGKVNGSERVLCRCDCGTVQEYSLSNLANGVTVRCSDRTEHADPRYKGDDITYDGAHSRTKGRRGSASLYLCWKCGAQAQDWAYSHTDPNEKRMSHGRDAGRPYTTDPSRNLPLCRACHKLFDSTTAPRMVASGVATTSPALALAWAYCADRPGMKDDAA
ncbi:hypothetical protein [Streptomyces sp. NPDC001508]|uniref:hypothetical protein n=1 Tax=Streptomyces sp. NPDC001508 TaxID=3154656 RepID=UPI00331E9520